LTSQVVGLLGHAVAGAHYRPVDRQRPFAEAPWAVAEGQKSGIHIVAELAENQSGIWAPRFSGRAMLEAPVLSEKMHERSGGASTRQQIIVARG
jgi:hypothetical protein